MSTTEKLKDLLRTATQIQLPSINQFLSINLKKMKEKLRLEERAKENGAKQLPSSTSDDFDDVESTIIHEIEAERARCLNEFNDHLTTYNQRLASLNIEARLTQITLAARHAIGEFKAQIHQGQVDLTSARDDVKQHAEHFESFKTKNKLDHPAHYPSSKLLHVGIIAILFIIEAALNASFLSVGNELGLLGGFGDAVVIAFLNIGGALFFGTYIVPWIWHSRIDWKLIGITLTTTFLVANFFFNISVAHYRDALASEIPEQATRMAFSSFVADPFNIPDFKSLMMVGVGFFFALIALIDGFKMDEPYPGYGHVDRLRRRAYDTYADQKSSLLDALRTTRDEASSALTQLKDDLVKRRQEHDSIIANRHNLLANFDSHQHYLESCGREMITFYRAKNREVRNTPAPKYFDQAWHLEKKTSPMLPEQPLPTKRLNSVMSEANSTIQSAISEVMEAFDHAVTMTEQITEIINSKEEERVEA